jgi:hypothetical protein
MNIQPWGCAVMSEQRVCTRDSGPPTDGTVGPTYSEGDEVSDPVGRAEAPNIVGPSLLRHGQSQHSGSATFSTTKELPYSAKSTNSGDRKQDKPISPNQAKRVYICVTTDEPTSRVDDKWPRLSPTNTGCTGIGRRHACRRGSI